MVVPPPGLDVPVVFPSAGTAIDSITFPCSDSPPFVPLNATTARTGRPALADDPLIDDEQPPLVGLRLELARILVQDSLSSAFSFRSR